MNSAALICRRTPSKAIGKPKPYEKNARTHSAKQLAQIRDSFRNLGSILQKIRAGGTAHPAHSHYETLERINDYTANYHHGEGASGAAEPVLDPTELMGYVSTALALHA